MHTSKSCNFETFYFFGYFFLICPIFSPFHIKNKSNDAKYKNSNGKSIEHFKAGHIGPFHYYYYRQQIERFSLVVSLFFLILGQRLNYFALYKLYLATILLI